MKTKLLICFFILLSVPVFILGCGKNSSHNTTLLPDNQETTSIDNESSPASPELTDYSEIYSGIIENAYNIVKASDDEYDPDKNEFGLWQATIGFSSQESLSNIGYSIKDINGDNVPELLIACMEDENNAKYILELYTIKNGKPVHLIEGSARNSFSLLSDGKVFNLGSNGAGSYSFGVFGFNDSNDFVCEEVYFCDTDYNTDITSYYYNKNGVCDKDDEQTIVLDYSEEEFNAVDSSFAEKQIVFEATAFADYDSSNTNKEYGDTLNIDYYDDVSSDFSSFTEYKDSDDEYSTTIVIHCEKDIKNFSLFALSDRSIDDDGNITFEKDVRFSAEELSADKPLMAQILFVGDLPEWGISYTDSEGREVIKLIEMSGMDGSVFLSDF